MKYVLIHGHLFDGTKDAILKENVHIYVENQKIIDVVENESTPQAGYEVIDLKGRYILPGLINLQVHLFGSGKPSKGLGGGSLQQTVIKLASTSLGQKILHKIIAENMKMALYSGVTTIRGVGDFFYSDTFIRDQIHQQKMIGPTLYVSGPAITVKGGHGDGTFALTSNDIEDLKQFVLQNHQHQVDLIKICVTGGVMDAKVKGEPGELKMNLEQTKAVCDQAHTLGYQVASHTESMEGVKVALKGGVDTIEHGSALDDECIQLFKEHASSLICTLSPALPLAKLSPQLTKLDDLCFYNANIVYQGMLEGCRRALSENIPVGLGTDASCPFVTQYNMWREIVYFAKTMHVSPAFALHTATLKNAEILHIDHLTGSIAPGKYADMVICDQNPLEVICALAQLHMVINQGTFYLYLQYKKYTMIEQ